MIWAQLVPFVTGAVDQELLLRNEYLAAENRILKAQIKGRLLLSQEEKVTLAEIAHRLGRGMPGKAHPIWRVFAAASLAAIFAALP
jgi:putative transposase